MRSILSLCLVSLALAACSPAADTGAPQAETPAPEVAAPPAVDAPPAVPVELAIVDANGAHMIGDAERGRLRFQQCAACHSVEAGVNKSGPSLHGVIGRVAGSVSGFNYSQANRASGVTWTEQELFDYLENPRLRIPGTTMAFAGIRNPQQRADVIAYIKTASETP